MIASQPLRGAVLAEEWRAPAYGQSPRSSSRPRRRRWPVAQSRRLGRGACVPGGATAATGRTRHDVRSLFGGRSYRGGRVQVYGCSPGCLVLSLAVSLFLTLLINLLIRLV